MMTVNPEASSGAITKCPNCGAPIRAGELVCHNCNYSLTGISGSTRALEKAEETFEFSRTKSIGTAIGKLQRISFIIEGSELTLPTGTRLVIGRRDTTATATMPDVDLARFDAENLGVSRQHIELTWRSGLIYVNDMGSTNGTLLNGQRLVAGIERILRDNDELVIGHMRAIVHFIMG
jgi:hypothetical protein